MYKHLMPGQRHQTVHEFKDGKKVTIKYFSKNAYNLHINYLHNLHHQLPA